MNPVIIIAMPNFIDTRAAMGMPAKTITTLETSKAFAVTFSRRMD